MITLYTFGPAFGMPDPSPFVMKADMLLKMSGLDYTTDTGGFGKAPKGKLPYIRDGEEVIADSFFIRRHLEETYDIDFDSHLDDRERGIALGLEKMLEDHLYWVVIQDRWMDPANFDKGPRMFFDKVPAPIRPFIIRRVKAKVARNLFGHGMGRHTPGEVAVLGDKTIAALSAVLGDRSHFMGEEPCGLDATAFAFIASAACPHFETPLGTAIRAHQNLTAYCDRMMATHYPEIARP